MILLKCQHFPSRVRKYAVTAAFLRIFVLVSTLIFTSDVFLTSAVGFSCIPRKWLLYTFLKNYDFMIEKFYIRNPDEVA